MISCKEFEDLLPEWVAGRLSNVQATQMEQHCAACPTCAHAEAAESDLRARWRVLQTVQNTPDIRPRLAARLAEAAAASRALFVRRMALVGGAFATAALCALMIFHTAHSSREKAVNEAHVVNLVAEMQQLPYPEEDRMISALYRQEERLILVGNKAR